MNNDYIELSKDSIQKTSDQDSLTLIQSENSSLLRSVDKSFDFINPEVSDLKASLLKQNRSLDLPKMHALIITFTKPKIPKYETLSFVCKSLEECENKLIINLKNNIYANIDYPTDIDDYSTLFWYNDHSMDNHFFDYQIFYEDKWIKPWELQDIYEKVINIIHIVDIQNSIYDSNNYYDNDDEN